MITVRVRVIPSPTTTNFLLKSGRRVGGGASEYVETMAACIQERMNLSQAERYIDLLETERRK